MRLQTLAWVGAVGAVLFGLAASGCGGPQDGPPGPLSKRFDDMYIATVPVTDKPVVIKTQNDWSVAKMEKAKADADAAEAGVLLDVAKNEREATRLDEKSAQSRKKAADQSADQNRVNAAMKEVRGAELARRAADERVKYLEAYREWLKVLVRFTDHQMYWREAQFELAKAKIARDRNIQPKGFAYDDFVRQEQDRARKSADGRTKSERARSKAFEARSRWMSLQGESDKLLGRKSAFPDPLAPKAASDGSGFSQSTGGGQ
jgi:hypothetical protein